MKTKTVIAAAAATCAMAGLPAHSAVLTLGSGWESIVYFNPNPPPSTFGGPIYDYNEYLHGLLDTDFTFTLTKGADLRITDAFYNLDMFDLVVENVDTGVIVDEGLTSTPLQSFAYQPSYDLAYADPHFSHGVYLLGPGTYKVTGTAIFVPFQYGVGVAGIELAVPEPAAWAMMLVGFGAIGGMARRRRARRSPIAA